MGTKTIHQLIKKPDESLIDMLCKKHCAVTIPSYTFIHSMLKENKNHAFKTFLKHLANQKSEIFEDCDLVKILFEISNLKDFWIQDISTWTKKSRSREKQFYDIINHLFVKYEMPTFMYNVWSIKGNQNLNQKEVEWFFDMGSGRNIRKSKGLPLTLTKVQAHLFKSAPDYFKPYEAIRYAQIISMGGDMRTVNGFMTSKISTNFNDNHFWESVIKYFIDNPMLDTVHYNTIIDYIDYVKFTSRVLVNGRYVPEKPNFSMKDRDVNTLLEAVEKWHKQTSKITKKGIPESWVPFTINNFEYETGKEDKKTTYTIKQILTGKDLLTEGRAMNHCVGSYAGSCADGRTSIWSLRSNIFGLETRMVTIEVGKDYTVRQIRGKGNRKPSDYEISLINKWAEKERITISRWSA